MPGRSSAERRIRTSALGLCLALASGCATAAGPGLRAGERAETARNYDLAVVEYTKAVRANPDDVNARLALERAKLRASQEHAFRARTLAAAERYEGALGEYQIASELNPSDAIVDEALRDTRQKLRTKIAVTRNGKTRSSRSSSDPGICHRQDWTCRPTPGSPTRSSSATASSRDVFTIAGAVRGAQRRLRPGVPRRDHQRRLAKDDARRAGAGVGLGQHAHLLPDHRAAHDHHHPGHASQAPRVRRGRRPHLLPEQRRPQGNHRPAADRRRRPPDLAADRHQRHRAQGHARARGRGRRGSSRRSTRPGPRSSSTSSCSKSTGHACASTASRSPRPDPTGIDGAADVNRDGLTLQDLPNLTRADVFLTGVPALFYRLLKTDTNSRIAREPAAADV